MSAGDFFGQPREEREMEIYFLEEKAMTERALTEARCSNCGGSGYRFQALRGVNPFLARIEQLARILQRVTCWSCNGTGRRIQESTDAVS